MRLSHITTIIVVIAILCCATAAFAGPKVQFSMTSDKKKYLAGDPINVDFTLKNKSKKPVYVNSRFLLTTEENVPAEGEIYLVVTTPSGTKETLKTAPETELPRSDNFVLLKKGEETTSKRSKNIKYYFPFEEIGKYTIKGVYQNSFGKEIGFDVFSKKLKAKPLKIKIIEGKEEK